MSSRRGLQSAPDRGTRRPPRHQADRASIKTRQMEHIASVSRSSGLEKDGDALKDFKIQEEYREFIEAKLNGLQAIHSAKPSEIKTEARRRSDAQENVMILFRKLREGLVSSKRNDPFALEVYETSLYLAVLFDFPRQIASVLPRLIPDLYINSPSPPNRLTTLLISLLHLLVSSYPSQSTFHQYLDSLPSSFLPANAEARRWISALSSSARSRNYVKFEVLTRPTTFSRFLQDESTSASHSASPQSNHILAKTALFSLVDVLRGKVRETTWTVIRSAYRELSCHTEAEGTRDWLARSLTLHSVVPDEKDVSVDEWLAEQSRLGHVRPKEGVEGKWIICKIR